MSTRIQLRLPAGLAAQVMARARQSTARGKPTHFSTDAAALAHGVREGLAEQLARLSPPPQFGDIAAASHAIEEATARLEVYRHRLDMVPDALAAGVSQALILGAHENSDRDRRECDHQCEVITDRIAQLQGMSRPQLLAQHQEANKAVAHVLHTPWPPTARPVPEEILAFALLRLGVVDEYPCEPLFCKLQPLCPAQPSTVSESIREVPDNTNDQLVEQVLHADAVVAQRIESFSAALKRSQNRVVCALLADQMSGRSFSHRHIFVMLSRTARTLERLQHCCRSDRSAAAIPLLLSDPDRIRVINEWKAIPAKPKLTPPPLIPPEAEFLRHVAEEAARLERQALTSMQLTAGLATTYESEFRAFIRRLLSASGFVAGKNWIAPGRVLTPEAFSMLRFLTALNFVRRS